MPFNATVIPSIHRWKTLYTRYITSVGRKYQLTQNECDVLLFLYNHPPYNTATDIATHRLIAKSNVSTAVESLKRRGFLIAQQDEDNRRIIRLFLSPSVAQLTIELKEKQRSFERMLGQGITKKEHEFLAQLFQRMNQNATIALTELEKETES